ncbi:MAG: PEGA domain-containing protein [Acidobacteriota bacterium]
MSEDSAEVRAMWAPQVKVAGPALAPLAPTEAPSEFDGEPDEASGAEPAVTVTEREETTPAPAIPKLAIAGPRVDPVVTPAAPTPTASTSPAQRPAAVRVLPPSAPPSPSRTTWMVIAAIVVIAATIGAAALWRERSGQIPRDAAPLPASQGTATIVSRPAGAEVLLNGASRGTTPLKLSLPVGSYDLELRNDTSKRSLTLTVEASTAVREFVDLAPDGGRGSVDISTDVAGARITIDGVSRGVTPLTVNDLEPGTHRIGMSNNGTTIFRTVTVAAGATTAVVASVAPAGATGGWLTIESPLELQVLEGNEVVGTTKASRLMLPAGRHELVLAAPAFDFETSITAQIAPGRTVSVPVSVPNGTLSINAAPWADVIIDGRPVGSTPIGNLSVSVGPHDVVWRHPQLGERRQVVAVGARAPARASVDLTRTP